MAALGDDAMEIICFTIEASQHLEQENHELINFLFINRKRKKLVSCLMISLNFIKLKETF